MNKSDIPQHINSRQLAKDNGYGFFHGTVCRKGHDGFRYVGGHCVQCTLEKSRTEERRIKKAEYRASEAGKAVTKEYNIKYYYENHEYSLQRIKDYIKNNPDKVKEARKKSQDKKNVNTANYRSKLKGGGTHTFKEAMAILEIQKHKCVNCKCKLTNQNKHKDHIIPVSKGGNNTKHNIQWLCQKCNLVKHAKDPIKWAQQNGRLL